VSKYLSDVFFHFVGRRDPNDHAGNYATLQKVLNSGQVRASPSDLRPPSVRRDLSRSLASEKLLETSQTCFAEIRPEHLNIHVAKYGHFGVGFAREVMTMFGARPVIYIPTHPRDWQSIDGTSALKDIEAIYRGFLEHVVEPRNFPETTSRTMGTIPANADDATCAMLGIIERYFLTYIKPFRSDLAEDHASYYYAEREWRSPLSVPFKQGDIRFVIVHPAYLERFAADHSSLADRCHASDELERDLHGM
jgi:Putative abortive phage resistance protein AbiGi, antitoxin